MPRLQEGSESRCWGGGLCVGGVSLKGNTAVVTTPEIDSPLCQPFFKRAPGFPKIGSVFGIFLFALSLNTPRRVAGEFLGIRLIPMTTRLGGEAVT